DLPQVLVERAAQPREALVVDRVQLDLDRFCSQASSPRRECDRADVIFTSAKPCAGPRKFTMRLLPVRPASSVLSFLEGPSTSTRCVVPTMLSLTARACASSCACSLCRRSCFSESGTGSGSSAAGVPGRGL